MSMELEGFLGLGETALVTEGEVGKETMSPSNLGELVLGRKSFKTETIFRCGESPPIV